MNTSSRAIAPVANSACNDSPTSRSFRYRSAQSKWRNPTLNAFVVALLVSAGSGIKVPKPRAGMAPIPKLRGIFAERRFEGLLDVIEYNGSDQCFFNAENAKMLCHVISSCAFTLLQAR